MASGVDVNADVDIATLSTARLARLLVRHRRGDTLERLEPALDSFLREVLSKANAFVPSESGAILLDDPRAKMFNSSRNSLTVIAASGELATSLLGVEFPPGEGLVGEVYDSGRAIRGGPQRHCPLVARTDVQLGSLLGVPVVLGNAVCGVLLLVNRRGHDTFSEQDHKLIDIFAGYISSSIQNAIDGLRARELAQRDDLTGLHNDRYLHQRLRAEIARADRQRTDLSLVFVDLDHFKSINDRFGHLEGSRTLHLVGILLENEVPLEAIAARYGGDEFVVILPGVPLRGAQEAAEYLREKISTTPMAIDSPLTEGVHYLSASLGVASLHDHVRCQRVTARANSLIRLADTAMYRAKAEGRNRVVVAQVEPQEPDQELHH